MPPPAPAPPRPPRRWLPLAALALGLLIVGVFGVRAFNQWRFAQRVASGQVQVESLRGWMTLRYIAHTHQVPEARLRAALGVPPTGGDERSLHDWLVAERIDPLVGRRALEAVILQQQQQRAASMPSGATPSASSTASPAASSARAP